MGHSNDILPTCCAAACIDVPAEAKIDGVNLLPHMTSRAAIERGTVFWQMELYKGFQRHEPKPKPYATEVVRSGKWKLLAKGGEGVALYDLATDPGESVNLLDKHASVVARLEEELRGWLAAPRKRWKETA
ncbi:MAG: hypothetical protein R6V12_12670 [Candidatus Hydrogenedentota bacterium]